jgi:RES domain-containing protein
VDCEDVADLRTDAPRAEHGVTLDDLACAWGDALIAGREPASWAVVRRLLAEGCAGALPNRLPPFFGRKDWKVR